VSEKKLKSLNIWQSYKQDRGCLMHFVRLANTLLKDEESHGTILYPVTVSLNFLGQLSVFFSGMGVLLF